MGRLTAKERTAKPLLPGKRPSWRFGRWIRWKLSRAPAWLRPGHPFNASLGGLGKCNAIRLIGSCRSIAP